MDLSQLDAIFIVGIFGWVEICFDQMTVVNLSQFFVVEVLDEEVEHFLVLFIDRFGSFFLGFFLALGGVDEINFLLLFRH